jgi:RNA 3'-terminal phosphate cyclase (ATP)
MPWSPSFDYLEAVWLPLLRRLGISAEIAAAATGWFPIGKGEISATIAGLGKDRCGALQPASLVERGALVRILGRAIAANLPSHIPQRMVDRARSLLQPLGVELRLVAERVQAACPGAGLFLTAEFENVRGGVGAQGERGKSSEAVAEEAVTSLVAYLDSRAAVDAHLADQILAPLALAGGPSTFSAERCTRHLETNAWVIDRFGLAAITIEKRTDGTARVDVRPTGSHRGDPEH